MPPIFRASELDRLMDCPGSAWLPRKENKEGVAAAWGTKVHAWLETGLITNDDDGMALAKRIAKSGVDRAKLWPSGEHEVPLAYNLVTGAVSRYPAPALLPGVIRRDHISEWKRSFSDEWFTGSIDFATELVDTYWIDDLKTGRHVTWGQYQWQQVAYAIMWSTYKYGDLRAGRSTVTHWPRYPIARPPNRLGTQLSAEFLQEGLDKLRGLREKILRAADDDLETGEQCQWCPSNQNCSKYAKLD